MLKKYSTPNNIKKRGINLANSYKAFILSIFFLFTLTILVAQNNTNKSPALETLIQQIDENYVPNGWNDTMNSMDKLAGNIPQIYFTFLGTAMNKQEPYIDNNPIANKNYKNLNQEILFLIPDLVNLKNSKISNNDELINDRTLGDLYMEAVWGEINETFNKNYKEHTGKDLSQISMSSVLDQTTVGGTSFRKVAKKDKNEIKLLSEVAPAATYDPTKNDSQVSNLPYSTGQCPKQSNQENSYVKTGTSCTYEDGMLNIETQMVNYKRHGVQKYYRVEKGRHYMSLSIPYTNDKKDGMEKSYDYDDKSGRVYLTGRKPYKSGLIDGTVERYTIKDGTYHLIDSTPYVNGKEHGVKIYYAWISYNSGPAKPFLKWKTVYAHGKRVEMIEYDDHGTIRAHVRYRDGKRIEN